MSAAPVRPVVTGADLDAVLRTANRRPGQSDTEAEQPRGPGHLRRLRYRLRRQLYPHYAAGGLLAVAGVVEAAHSATDGAGRAWVTAGSIMCVAIAGLVLTRTRLGGRALGVVPRGLRSWLTVCAAAAAAWLIVAVYRLTFTWAVVLAVLTVALGARWWRHVRDLGPDREPEPAPEPEPAAAPQPFQQMYDANVGGKGCALEGSRVFAVDRLPTGVLECQVQGKRGKHTLTTFLSNVGAIASGTDVPVENLTILPHPSGTPSQVVIRVIEQSPLKHDVVFDRPRIRGGIIDIGPYGDLDGEAPYRLYTPGDTEADGSMWSGFCVGDTGIGKSREVENLATNIMSGWNSHPTTVWFCDPQNGASSPSLRDHADWFCDLDKFVEVMLPALEEIADWRGHESTNRDLTGFRPVRCTCPDPEQAVQGSDHPGCEYRPGIWLVLEECHQPFGLDGIAGRVGDLARTGRKIGIAVHAQSQYSGVATFNGVSALQSSLFAGNILVHHVSNRLGGALIPGLQVDPLDLPQDPPGYGYTQQIGAYGRTAPYRNRLIRNPHTWMSRYPRLALDPLASHAADYATDGAYSARAGNAAERRQASAELVDAMRRGDFEEVARLRRHRSISPATNAQTGDVVQFPTWPPANAADSADQSGAPAAVLEAIAGGATTPQTIADTTGYSERSIHRALTDLTADGTITKTGRGIYQPTTHQQTA